MTITYIYLTAPFVDTKSTCGAAISTTTTVDGGADDDWKQDENGDDIKKLMLRKIALQLKCRICGKTEAETEFSSSEAIKLHRGEQVTCQSCHPVGLRSGRDFCAVMPMHVTFSSFVLRLIRAS